MKIGFIGLGMVGQTTADWFSENTDHDLFFYDPPKEINGFYLGLELDAVFISVPVDTNSDGTQDLSIAFQAVETARFYTENIFMRSTVLPGSCQQLSLMTGAKVWAMPEFLTERTAADDFAVLDIITGCPDHELLDEIFIGKKNYIQVSNREAELGKYAHNVFAAMKVHFFNKIYDYCEASDMDYRNVKKVFLESGFINRIHTQVPGPDGQLGFGGKCLPKDLLAFAEKTEDSILKTIYMENLSVREELPSQEILEENDTCCGGGCGCSH